MDKQEEGVPYNPLFGPGSAQPGQKALKVLITGNLGFVGAETQRYLTRAGLDVVGFDIMDKNDIRNAAAFERCVSESQPDRILHLAAIARFSDADRDPQLAFETNVLGTLNVTSMARKYGIPLVYASTGSVYMPVDKDPPITEEFEGRGNSIYGCTKYMGEKYVEQQTPHIILRYAHLYGQEKRGHGLIGGFIDRISRGLQPILYGGKQSNDFTYIKDVARANFLAIISSWDKWNQIYNIGTGEELSAEAAGQMICDATGYKGKIDRREQRTVDPERFVFDVNKAERMLGFRATYMFKDGLADMFPKK